MKLKKISFLILGIFLFQIANSQVFELENNPNKPITITVKENPKTSSDNKKDNVISNGILDNETIVNKTETDDEVIIPARPVVDKWMATVQAKVRNYESIETLLKNGQNPNQGIFDGSTILHLAAWQNDEQLFRLGLKYSASIFYLNQNGETPLHWAAYSNNPNIIAMVLNDKQALKIINKQSKNGRTPLHFNALQNGNLDIAKQLISQKVDLNIKDKNGQTALHYALALRRWDLAKLYIESGADITLKDNNGDSFDDYLLRQGDIYGFQILYKYLTLKNQDVIKNRLGNLLII